MAFLVSPKPVLPLLPATARPLRPRGTGLSRPVSSWLWGCHHSVLPVSEPPSPRGRGGRGLEELQPSPPDGREGAGSARSDKSVQLNKEPSGERLGRRSGSRSLVWIIFDENLYFEVVVFIRNFPSES